MEYLISKTSYVNHWYKQRFSVDNMITHFFSVFTNGSVDTVDVTTRKPADSSHRNSIYTLKSKTCCIKWQVLCDNRGHIIHVTGPFSSLDYDGHIWNDTVEELGLWNGIDEDNPEHANRYEVFMGDKHYMTSTQYIVPVSKRDKKKNRVDPMETAYNDIVGSTRSTIEQVFGYLKTWAILGTVYRGMLLTDTGYTFLSTAFRLCCELYNARFTILGHKKREIRVYARDENGVPLCPPYNVTSDNLRTRSNLHHQLSKFDKISYDEFFAASDIDSKNSRSSFRTGDHVWIFDEGNQSFVKANITGCVDGLFSTRSANKKICLTGVSPKIIFPRTKNSNDKPIISHYVVPAIVNFIANQCISDYSSTSSSNTLHSNPSSVPDDGDDSIDDEVTFLDEEFLFELGADNEINVDINGDSESGEESTSSMETDEEKTISHDDDYMDQTEHPWKLFSTFKDNQLICSSPNDGIDIYRKDAVTLVKGRWLNDEVLNYFSTSANRFHRTTQSDEEAATGRSYKFFICSTWLFSVISTISMPGEIGRYNYKAAWRYFRTQNQSIWTLDRVCIYQCTFRTRTGYAAY